MSKYINRSKVNRVKICCIEDLNFETGIDYLFTFCHLFCGKEITMLLKGDFCGDCAEFSFLEDCNGTGDIDIKEGIYSLVITKTTDNSVLFKTNQLRVQ